MMSEIRIHGRGGQGSVVASKILAAAAFVCGHQVQSFPIFGVERRGTPVEAFLRIAADRILIRSEVTAPDIVVILDPSLIGMIDCTAGLKPTGTLLINTHKTPEELALPGLFRICCVNAATIATGLHLGSIQAPIVNTAICGAFAKVTGLMSIDAVCDAIIEEVPAMAKNNCEAARLAYTSTHG